MGGAGVGGAVVSGLGSAETAAGIAGGASIASSLGAGEIAGIASGVGASGADAGSAVSGLEVVGDAVVSSVGVDGIMPVVSDLGDAVASALGTGGTGTVSPGLGTTGAAATVGTRLLTSGTSLNSILPTLLPSIGIGLLKVYLTWIILLN